MQGPGEALPTATCQGNTGYNNFFGKGIVDALKAAKDAYWMTEVEVQRLGAAAWVAFARGNRETALDLMRAAGRPRKAELAALRAQLERATAHRSGRRSERTPKPSGWRRPG